MNGTILIIATYIIVAVLLVVIVLIVSKKRRDKNLQTTIEELDREKNIIESTPILLELAKVETIIKNDKMEENTSNGKKDLKT